jgi:hypothetical protein
MQADPEGDREGGRLELTDLSDALEQMKTDASKLLMDLLRGIAMWGITALMAFFLAFVWLALAEVVLVYAHPYGSLPQILDILYASYGFAAGSAILGLVLFWRYFSLKRKYVRLFGIARKLR